MAGPETERDLRRADCKEVSGIAGAPGAVLGWTSPANADFFSQHL